MGKKKKYLLNLKISATVNLVPPYIEPRLTVLSVTLADTHQLSLKIYLGTKTNET